MFIHLNLIIKIKLVLKIYKMMIMMKLKKNKLNFRKYPTLISNNK